MPTVSSKIFLDSADPEEVRKADELLKAGGLPGVEGVTTNPSLIAKLMKEMHEKPDNADGENISHPSDFSSVSDILSHYRRIVTDMAKIISGPVSIQVTVPPDAPVEDLLSQARDRIRWIPNGVIKFPCTAAGLEAASVFCEEGPVNMTLVFTQEQAAAAYAATKTHNYDVYLSPFVGRLDDRGENGMDIVANILAMYRELGDGHVRVITASTRTYAHLQYALFLKSDIITLPLKIMEEWSANGFGLPGEEYIYDIPGLTEMPYREITLENDWQTYEIRHDLTAAGVIKFWYDWYNVSK